MIAQLIKAIFQDFRLFIYLSIVILVCLRSQAILWYGGEDKPLEMLLNETAYMTGNGYAVEFVDINDIPSEECMLKVYIQKNYKQLLIRELDQLGINSKALFPGLDGIRKYIERKFRFDYNEFCNC